VYNFSDRGPDWIHDYYLYVDEVLGRVLSQVDATKTTVVLASDHGFEINREEPEWASRHRDPGLLIGWGARVKEDVSYSRVGQLDLGVTMFSLVGVAPGADAKGRQLEELFDLSGAGAPLGSWILEEHLPLINGEEDASTDALMQELETLGYVDELGEERTDLQRSP
jgi:hypothetical protein